MMASRVSNSDLAVEGCVQARCVVRGSIGGLGCQWLVVDFTTKPVPVAL